PDEIVRLFLEELRAEDDREAAKRSQRSGTPVVEPLSGLANPERVEVGAETLRRTPGAPQDSLRLRLRLDEDQHTLVDGLLAQRVEDRRSALRLDVLGHLTQCQLAEGAEVVAPEEVRQRSLDALLRIDLPCT